MSFPLTGPSSPPLDPHGAQRPGADVDLLASALQNALQGISNHSQPSQPSSSRTPQDEMTKKEEKFPNVEIVVHSDFLTLKGTGVDVAPTLLSGHVVLNLAESTSIKEITLQFRGKARLPPPANEPMTLNSSAMTYIVCNHDWSFLEGERKHSHTLKAGRHLFPFQLRIGGSLPSSVSTGVLGGASVAYKLRAVAVRPGLAHNLVAQIPISIARSFAPEALEYQQTLEIENTWPEKIMYSIMIPHKAWAAGDAVTAVVKFSPLNKGVRVLSVGTTINETIKLFAKSGWQECTKPVVVTKHEFHGGHAICVDHRRISPHGRNSHSYPSTPGSATPALASGAVSPPLTGPSTYFSGPHSSESPSGESPVAGPSSQREGEPSHDVPIDFEVSDEDVVAMVDVQIPLHATPTHNLDPIIISHRIRWSILINNLDGHTSELRCSLPLHILDHRLIDEAKSATAATRRLLLGSSDVPEENDEEMELPSYSSHVRDRVANMYLPEQAVMRVTNPWIHQGISPVQQDHLRAAGVTMRSAPGSGTHTPLEAHHIPSALSSTPITNLDYVNSELLLSLSAEAPPALDTAPPSAISSPTITRPQSRAPSRPPSPPPLGLSLSRRSSAGSSSPDPASTYVHEHSSASRNLHGLFHISMKPFTSLTSSFTHSTRGHTGTPPTPRTPATPPVMRAPANTSHSLLHRAFTEVPDYGIAARGFLGGVTPLESMQGLPSYEEAEVQHSQSLSEAQRAQSAPDLQAMVERARSMNAARSPSDPVNVAQTILS
ncbi:hypothetical protein BV25DRAFT_1849481 [Artomyces pyxidatus]|uniref:Uncharacterized protein n=1 Tax=Artomyces pyxidatus TaxID=48021 RepID=A0ACB8TC54_9AGAM|nr:hypothetical protein BV25DRAFT_1849481 [Artomyces pyxidatus]